MVSILLLLRERVRQTGECTVNSWYCVYLEIAECCLALKSDFWNGGVGKYLNMFELFHRIVLAGKPWKILKFRESFQSNE